MLELISILAISGLLIIVALILLSGKGSSLIMGYNTMPKEKKEKYDAKALSKFIGMIVLLIGIMLAFVSIESIRSWYVWVFVTITFALVIFCTIYLNTGNRYKK